MTNLLFGVSAVNPVVLAIVCGLLLIVAIAATGIPALARRSDRSARRAPPGLEVQRLFQRDSSARSA